ncbi:hypothetical protein DRN73_08275 [Candidatus Pacearchaeota archaeon]|nr:MAG: hypothetical protein DRN73_08275 [Candidatus Pacearchaeota archaeon]
MLILYLILNIFSISAKSFSGFYGFDYSNFFLNPSGIYGYSRPYINATAHLWKDNLGLSLCGTYKVAKDISSGAFVFFDTYKEEKQSGAGFVISYEYKNYHFGATVKVFDGLNPYTTVSEGFGSNISFGFDVFENLNIFSGISEINFKKKPTILWTGAKYAFKNRFENFQSNLSGLLWLYSGDLNLAIGGEVWFLKNQFSLRGGIGIGEKEDYWLRLGFGFKTNFVEYTDYQFDYSVQFSKEGKSRHYIGISTFIGDEYKEEKERKKREEQLRKLKEWEKDLKEREAKLKENIKKLKQTLKTLKEEKKKLMEEKARLEKERKEVEKMRKEALEALKKIEGLKIREEKEYIRITASEKAVHFELGGTGLLPDGILVLKKIAKFLKTYPNYKVTIEGHTDNIPIGPLLKKKYKDNMELSLARAKVVRDYFVKVEGLPKRMFEVKGYGDTRPIASNATEEGRSLNRRVEIIIHKK